MFVGSLTLALNDPPPETVAEFVVLAGALIATFAVTVIGGYAAPVGSESLRVQEVPVQVQPEPETVAEFVVLAGALIATFAVTVIGGYAAPVGSESLRVQEVPVQVQPEPESPTGIRPEPGVSITVTVPPVGPALAALATVSVYVALLCPCVNGSVCAEVMVSDGGSTRKVAATLLGTDMVRVCAQLENECRSRSRRAGLRRWRTGAIPKSCCPKARRRNGATRSPA